MIYTFSAFRLDTVAGTIHHKNEKLKLRPKSVKVMCYLVENRDHIVSKQDLTHAIWDDVFTDNQVIFQSIAEIRSILLDKNCIVTHPRKGYQWTTPIETIEKLAPKTTKRRGFLTAPKMVSLSLFSLLVVALGLRYLSEFTQDKRFPIRPGTVAILPITSELDEGQHDWLRFGGMDMISRHLKATHLRVLPSIEVLTALNNAGAFLATTPEQTAFRLRTRLGVNTIVHIRLMDAPMGYQAHYKLMHKNAFDRGVVFHDNLPTLITELADRIAYKFDKQIQTPIRAYKNAFSEETFLTGLEYFTQQDYTLAEPFLRSAYLLNPHHLNAHVFLIQNLIALGKLDEAERHATKMLDVNEAKAHIYATSLFAQIRGRRGFHAESLSLLKSSYALTDSFGDKLYVAMSYLELAKNTSELTDMAPAKSYFDAALSLQESFGCGYGLVSVLSEYSALWRTHGNPEMAASLLDRALTEADTFNLTQSKVTILLSLADLYIAQNATEKAFIFAKQAFDFSIKLQNRQLSQRVEDWTIRNRVRNTRTSAGLLPPP